MTDTLTFEPSDEGSYPIVINVATCCICFDVHRNDERCETPAVTVIDGFAVCGDHAQLMRATNYKYTALIKHAQMAAAAPTTGDDNGQ